MCNSATHACDLLSNKCTMRLSVWHFAPIANFDILGNSVFFTKAKTTIIIENVTLHSPKRIPMLVPLPLTTAQIARFMGPTWGPPGDDRTQVDPMLAPWTLLSTNAAPMHTRINSRIELFSARIFFLILLLGKLLKNYSFYTLSREYRVAGYRYSRLLFTSVKIAFAPICACSDNRRIWRHNTSFSRSRDVTDQLWWRHNAESENATLGNNGEMSARW